MRARTRRSRSTMLELQRATSRARACRMIAGSHDVAAQNDANDARTTHGVAHERAHHAIPCRRRMSFFKLTHPPYKTDQEFNRRNPVIETSYGHIPGIVCPVCGVWLSSDRLRVSWSARVEKVARTNYQAPDEWSRSRTTWARLLRVEPEVVTPGATLGPPSGRCTAAIEEEVVHPFPGLVWITRRVRNVFTRAKLTGLSFAKVQLQPKRWQRDVWSSWSEEGRGGRARPQRRCAPATSAAG